MSDADDYAASMSQYTVATAIEKQNTFSERVMTKLIRGIAAVHGGDASQILELARQDGDGTIQAAWFTGTFKTLPVAIDTYRFTAPFNLWKFMNKPAGKVYNAAKQLEENYTWADKRALIFEGTAGPKELVWWTGRPDVSTGKWCIELPNQAGHIEPLAGFIAVLNSIWDPEW